MTASILVSIAVLWVAVGLGVLAYRRATLAIGAVSMPVGRRTPLTVDEICVIVERQLDHALPFYFVDGHIEISVIARQSGGWWLIVDDWPSKHVSDTSLLEAVRHKVGFQLTKPRRVGGEA